MREAIIQAQKAEKMNEVPVGAIIFDPILNVIVAKAHNMVEFYQNKLMHAEIIAINSAFQFCRNKDISHMMLFATLEPCIACMSCIIKSGIKKIYYALDDCKYGSLNGQYEHITFNKKSIEIYQGILESESRYILTSFFKNIRERNQVVKKF